jgi:hypothetical protein
LISLKKRLPISERSAFKAKGQKFSQPFTSLWALQTLRQSESPSANAGSPPYSGYKTEHLLAHECDDPQRENLSNRQTNERPSAQG